MMTQEPGSIDFIYFDLGNVLLNFCHRRACQQVADASHLSTEEVWQVVFQTSLVADYEVGKISDAQFHAGFCQATGAKVGLEVFLQAFSDIFALNQPVIPLVVELTQRSFPIGILSNTCNAHWEFAIREFPVLSACFPDYRVLSFRESSAKPDRGIYAAAIRTANRAVERNPSKLIDPARIFFVDDRPENVAGACQAGLDAVLFESANQLRAALVQRGLSV